MKARFQKDVIIIPRYNFDEDFESQARARGWIVCEYEEIGRCDTLDLFYTGLKVKVVNAENNLYGSLLSEYRKMGYLYVADIFENGNITISYSPVGGMLINFDKSVLESIYDDNILHVLNSKKRELKRISKEISDIERYVNKKCKSN